jgi:hypothetical protein
VSPHVAFAATAADRQKQFMKALDRMMVDLAPQSTRASKTIKDAYRRHMELLVLEEYAALEGALANGGLVPLPDDPLRFNLKPRLDGRFPIGEKDLDNQESYISARREAVGALIEIASRVRSGPLEITSMARHSEYQSTLRRTNSNANTAIPMHTMGLAVDIALINTPLNTVYEIRDVLSDMQRAGDILVIGERKQLVFHVVPHPARLGRFARVYDDAIADTMPGANIISLATSVPSFGVPYVIAEVIAIRPTTEWAKEWWAADNSSSDIVVQVTPAPEVEEPTFFGRVTAAMSSFFDAIGL